jgi:hypothetical protein
MRRNVFPVALLALAGTGLCVSARAAKPTRPGQREIASRPTALHGHSDPKTVRHPAATPAKTSAHRFVKPVPHAEAKAVHATQHTAAAKAHAARSETRPERTVRLAAERRRPAASHSPPHSAAHAKRSTAPIADQATLNRVHAWIRAQPGVQPPIKAALYADEPESHLRDAPLSKSTPEARETGVSHPPEDDAFPATSAPADEPIAALDLTLPSASRLSKSVEDEAAAPILIASLYDTRGRLVMPAALKGSHGILLHQNQMADRDDLDRVKDDTDLLELRHQKKLVALPESGSLRVDERLPANRRYARPWTAAFLSRIARDHYATFHSALQVNSAVRTTEFQLRLIRTNGNAAPADGDTASPHLTGQAIDIAKRGLTLPEIAWMRAYLQPLIEKGKIDVEEEFQQACFHISVYKAYQPPPAEPRLPITAARRAAPPVLATAPPPAEE